MNNLNSIILEGNLVRDAQLTEPAPGFKKCAFSIGVNRFFKNRKNEDVQEASFFDVEAYNQVAEWCGKKATKGRGVRVVGRLKQDTWKDENGKSASRIYVVAEHIEYKPMKKTEVEEVPETPESPDTNPPEDTKAQAEPQTEAQPVPVEKEVVF